MGEEAKSKIMEMPLQQRLKYGYKKVLDMLLVSGGISIVAVLLVYFGAKANIFGAESGTVATFFLVIGLALSLIHIWWTSYSILQQLSSTVLLQNNRRNRCLQPSRRNRNVHAWR